MIVVTGAAGFIASRLVEKLNNEGYHDLVLVDDFSRPEREYNYKDLKYSALVSRDTFIGWLKANANAVEFIFHLGARTDTTEFDYSIHQKLNLDYSIAVAEICTAEGIPLVYASSAATYGDGEFGYEDNHTLPFKLTPLNPYGVSKNEFDKWLLQQPKQPYFWAGLKFFNVYGPHETHKGRMASVVMHAFNQIKATGKMKLFQSHKDGIADGHQCRDFIYVKDVVDVCFWLMLHRKNSGLYNLGTGQARTFLDLTLATFDAMGVESDISFMPTPLDIRDKYQYFTEANMEKLRAIGYDKPFTSLEEGVKDYVSNYLLKQ